MGLIAGFVRAAFFSAVVGTAGYALGHGIGYDAGQEQGRQAQRASDARIVAREREEMALRLEGITTQSYARLRACIRKELERPVDLSDERYEGLRGQRRDALSGENAVRRLFK